MKLKYPDIHPLLIERSLDHKKTPEEINQLLTHLLVIKFPVCWCEVSQCWIHVELLPDYF